MLDVPTVVELIDHDGVLSAGFARHLAHRQRPIQTSYSVWLPTRFLPLSPSLRRPKKSPGSEKSSLSQQSLIAGLPTVVHLAATHCVQCAIDSRGRGEWTVTASIPRPLSTLPHWTSTTIGPHFQIKRGFSFNGGISFQLFQRILFFFFVLKLLCGCDSIGIRKREREKEKRMLFDNPKVLLTRLLNALYDVYKEEVGL